MKDLSRRQFIERTALAAAPMILLPQVAMARSNQTSDYRVVETRYGRLRGYHEKGINIFKGVPFAGEVSGKKRFQKAGPVKPWTGIRDALQLGNPSIQPPGQTYGINEPGPDEDCLVLNIWTPANDEKKRPVMVYNHGGGYLTGSGGSASQDGANLARMYDVVVVATAVFTLSEDDLKERLGRDFGDNAELIRGTYHKSNPGMSPGEIFTAVRSILMMGLGSIRIAERKTMQGGAPAYLYNFGYRSNAKIPGTEFDFGAMHALDIPFKFYNVEGGMAGTREDRFEASRNMTAFWTSFALSGKPEAAGQPEWPAYDLELRPAMRIDTACSVINDRFRTERLMWEKILK